jgi:hypothetical protein
MRARACLHVAAAQASMDHVWSRCGWGLRREVHYAFDNCSKLAPFGVFSEAREGGYHQYFVLSCKVPCGALRHDMEMESANLGIAVVTLLPHLMTTQPWDGATAPAGAP